MAAASSADLLDRLNRCLEKFQAVRVSDIMEVYSYFPSVALAKLGSGSYGDAYKMKRVGAADEPVRVVKAIPKARVSRSTTQVQHVCAELAVTGGLQHENLNRRVGLYHTEATMYIVLELCDGGRPDLSTRLYHVFAKYAPFRIPDVARLVAESGAAAAAGEADDARMTREDLVVRRELASLGLRAEVPSGSDIFNAIMLHKKLPAGKSLVIMKQVLAGLAFLHGNSVVHRDIKTENIVFGEDRRSVPLFGPDGVTVVGVRITEKLRVKIIDFGLVKYMLMSSFPTTPSPSTFEASDWDSAPDMRDVSTEAPAVVAVTPCGTELYCSLEVIHGIIRSNGGRVKWSSTVDALPKFDVYGAGTALYCMCNGRPPFRLAPSYRPITKEERLRQISLLLEKEPAFSSACPEPLRQLVLLLMVKDPSRRPSARRALEEALFAGVTDEFTYDVSADGRVAEVAATGAVSTPPPPPPQPAETTPAGPQAAAATEAADEAPDAGGVAEIMEVVRGREDNGDGAGKETAAE